MKEGWLEGAGEGEKHWSVLGRLRVNSNSGLQRAQWSTLYPRMSRSTGTAAGRTEWRGLTRTGGWRRKREGKRRVNEFVSWQSRSLFWMRLPTLTLFAWDAQSEALSCGQHMGLAPKKEESQKQSQTEYSLQLDGNFVNITTSVLLC